jgi:uncharacterized membrane protein SpoIIM required for sporulation
MPIERDEQAHLHHLGDLLRRARRGCRRLDAEELRALPRLYRFVSSLHARLETRGNDPGKLQMIREMLPRAHALLYRDIGGRRESPWKRVQRTLLVESPRTLRSEWRLLLLMLLFFYGLSIVSYIAVSRNLELAFTLFDPGVIAGEIGQLRDTAEGEPFRGNFTFGLGESPTTAGWIMAHNIGVSILFFASGLVPPLFLFLLATNGLMLGTYTGVASHWDQGLEISSILWCHGVLEIQAIVLAGMAGMILVRAWIAPGVWSRSQAMKLESRRALLVLAPVFPMLVFAGLIEGFISPHAPTPARLAVAVATGGALLLWVYLGGRNAPAPIKARS